MKDDNNRPNPRFSIISLLPSSDEVEKQSDMKNDIEKNLEDRFSGLNIYAQKKVNKFQVDFETLKTKYKKHKKEIVQNIFTEEEKKEILSSVDAIPEPKKNNFSGNTLVPGLIVGAVVLVVNVTNFFDDKKEQSNPQTVSEQSEQKTQNNVFLAENKKEDYVAKKTKENFLIDKSGNSSTDVNTQETVSEKNSDSKSDTSNIAVSKPVVISGLDEPTQINIVGNDSLSVKINDGEPVSSADVKPGDKIEFVEKESSSEQNFSSTQTYKIVEEGKIIERCYKDICFTGRVVFGSGIKDNEILMPPLKKGEYPIAINKSELDKIYTSRKLFVTVTLEHQTNNEFSYTITNRINNTNFNYSIKCFIPNGIYLLDYKLMEPNNIKLKKREVLDLEAKCVN